MRRLTATLGCLLALGSAGCQAVPAGPTSAQTPSSPVPSSASPPAASPSPDPTPSAASRCAARAEAMPLRDQAGQLLMVGVSGSLDAAERKAVTGQRVGSVILLGNSTAGVDATRDLTTALGGLAKDTPLLVAVDQEGGLVQRLSGPGFDEIPSAIRQARLSDGALTAKATTWARQLEDAGVHLNLAPVADVVPASKKSSNEPVAKLGRGYGSDPATVSAKVRAFIDGMHAGGVGATVKHFPGLGEVTGNTDFSSNVVDTVTSATHKGLRPFRDAVSEGVDAVMVSSAIYRRIDPDRRAVFSADVLGILRDWGFDGVVISDDLGAAAALRKVPARERGVRFVRAGGDLVINADPRLTSAMVAGLLAEAEQDERFAARVTESAARVLGLKEALGLLSCG